MFRQFIVSVRIKKIKNFYKIGTVFLNAEFLFIVPYIAI